MSKKEDVLEIDVSFLEPMKDRDTGDLRPLIGSIKENGVVEPIIVTRKRGHNGYYLIIAGYRRYQAALQAGLRVVPCIVREFNSSSSNREEFNPIEANFTRLSENSGRKDFSPVEEARIFQVLKEKYHLTEEEIAKRIGRTQEYVCLRLSLLKLEPQVKMFLSHGKISVSQAELLLQIDDPDLQIKLAESIPGEKLTVKRLEDKIKATLEKRTNSVQQPNLNATLKVECEVDLLVTNFLEKIKVHKAANKCGKCSRKNICAQLLNLEKEWRAANV